MSELVYPLPWDSEYFGFPVAQINGAHINEQTIDVIWDFCQKHQIRLLQYKCDCHDRNSVLLAEQRAFHFADIRLTFEQKLDQQTCPTINGFSFRQAENRDVSVLRNIANDLYKASRYHFDTNFPQDKVRTMYQDWIRKAVFGEFDDLAYVVCVQDRPIGYCSCRFEEDGLVIISLVGLDLAYGGKGLGQALLHYSMSDMRHKGFRLVEVVTQGRNYAAQRLYQRSGFLIQKTEIIYHRWFDKWER